MAGWGLNGNVLIACNCDWGCPCNFNARPSHGHCEGGWIWVIEKGHVDDVRLDGLGGRAVRRLAGGDPRRRAGAPRPTSTSAPTRRNVRR